MSEDFALEVLTDFFDAVEAGISAARQRIKEKHKIEPQRQSDLPADMEEIVYTRLIGTNGEYEKSEDFNNPRFKALFSTLQTHNGKMTADGYFLWIFPDGKAIGRKRKA